MKTYQTPDPLHGHGKAVPQPKLPTTRGKLPPWISACRADYHVIEHVRSNRTMRRARSDMAMQQMIAKGDYSCLVSLQFIRK